MTRLGVLFLVHFGLGVANDILSVSVQYTTTTLVYFVYIMTAMHTVYLLFPGMPLSLVDAILSRDGDWKAYGVIFAARMLAGCGVTLFFHPDVSLYGLVTAFYAYKEFLDCLIIGLCAIFTTIVLVFGISENDPALPWKSSSAHTIIGFLVGIVFFDSVFAPFCIGPVPGGGLFVSTQNRATAFAFHMFGTVAGAMISIPFAKRR